MKKSIFKKIAAIMLISFALTAVLLFGCKKNVGDVYDYAPIVLSPDFVLSAVDYSVDNETLDSESKLRFKVSYKNAEITEVTYSSVLNFYIDDNIQNSVLLEDLAGNIEYEMFFDWQAVAGNHNFKFEINLSSNSSTIIEETNTTNNSQTKSLYVAVKELVAVSETAVEPEEVNQIISADTDANIAGVLASEGITISTTVDPIKTTYSNGTSIIKAAIAKSDGTVDETKIVMSAKCNPGVSQGQSQEAHITLVTETLVGQNEVGIYNANEKLIIKDGFVSYVGLKSAKAGCEEPSNIQLLYSSPDAQSVFTAAVSDAIEELGEEAALARIPVILLSMREAFHFTQGSIDNAPTYTWEVISSNEPCSTDCDDGVEVLKYPYPGFTLKIKDDRTIITDINVAPNCNSSNNGEYEIEDCGGNKVTFPFNANRMMIRTKNSCVGHVHN